MTESRSASHFRRLYQSSPDPWGFQSSPYEQAKYKRTLEVLGERRFTSGLEVGCSIGILTRMLAERCTRLLGLDIVEEPLADARKRCADQPGVRFKRMQVPAEWPDERFDLIVLSEVLYFLTAEDIGRCAGLVRDALLPGGVVVLVNWSGNGNDPSSGDLAPDRFVAATAGMLRVVHAERQECYRLEVLTPV